MGVIENIGYILLGFIATVTVFLIILAILEKKLKIKVFMSKTSPNQIYIKKISNLDVNKPKESLKQLDKTAKSFFKEAFHIQGAPEYSELEKIFIKKNNKKATKFSNEMTKILYAKTEITKEKFQEMAKLLAEIVASNKILTKEEKQKLDKKSQEKNKSRKTNILGIFKKKPKNNKNKNSKK